MPAQKLEDEFSPGAHVAVETTRVVDTAWNPPRPMYPAQLGLVAWLI